MWGFPLQQMDGSMVVDVYCCAHSVLPKTIRQASLVEHGHCLIHNGVVKPLGFSILLGCNQHHELVFYSLLIYKGSDLSPYVLTTSVRP